MVPVKAAAKAAMKQPPKALEHEVATVHSPVGGAQVLPEKEAQEKDEAETAKPVAKPPKLPPLGLKGKLKAKGATGKKAAAKPDRRRKRKARAESESTCISQSSAQMLFRCTCQLLRSQTLDYDVRAWEMEDRNAAQAKEIEQWEKRVRSLKRELQEYAGESGGYPTESAGMALIEADPSAYAAAGPRGWKSATDCQQPWPRLLPRLLERAQRLMPRCHQQSPPLRPSCKKSCASERRR